MKNYKTWGVIFILIALITVIGCGNSPLSTISSTATPQTKENLNIIFIYDPNDPIKAYKPIRDIVVKVFNTADSSISYEHVSDCDGRIYLNVIPKGEYGIIISGESWARVSTCYIDHNQIKTEVMVDTFVTSPYDDPEYGVYLKKKNP